MPELSLLVERIYALLCYDSAQPLFFNSGLFLFLFLLFSAGYALLAGRWAQSVRLFYLTAFSYYFYYKNAGDYCALLAVITLGNYFVGRRIEQARTPGRRKGWVAVAVALMLGQLAYFKYTNFALSLVASFTGSAFQPLDIFLPAGISFFTFRNGILYVILTQCKIYELQAQVSTVVFYRGNVIKHFFESFV